MHEFGDGRLIVKNPGEASLLIIWIQLLVVFLLLYLLSSSLTLFVPPEHHPLSPSSSAIESRPATTTKQDATFRRTAVAGHSNSRQVGSDSVRTGCEMLAITASADAGLQRDGENEGVRLDRSSSSSSVEEETRSNVYHHPCYFMRLVGMVFIKCFGLDST